jgi:hypothetical protein
MKRYRMTPKKSMTTEIRIMEHKLGKSAKKLSTVGIEVYYQTLKRECKSKGLIK